MIDRKVLKLSTKFESGGIQGEQVNAMCAKARGSSASLLEGIEFDESHPQQYDQHEIAPEPEHPISC